MSDVDQPTVNVVPVDPFDGPPVTGIATLGGPVDVLDMLQLARQVIHRVPAAVWAKPNDISRFINSIDRCAEAEASLRRDSFPAALPALRWRVKARGRAARLLCGPLHVVQRRLDDWMDEAEGY